MEITVTPPIDESTVTRSVESVPGTATRNSSYQIPSFASKTLKDRMSQPAAPMADAIAPREPG